MLRFFAASEHVYESVRQSLDDAWGFPNADTKTLTSIDPAETALRGQDGRVLLVIAAHYCDYEPAATLLTQLLASGAVEEITQAEYQAALPQMP